VSKSDEKFAENLVAYALIATVVGIWMVGAGLFKATKYFLQKKEVW
jgi:hypothetical protein